MQITLFAQQSDSNLKITLLSKINSFILGIYNSQMKLHIPFKGMVSGYAKKHKHIITKVFHSTINFGVRFTAWHLEFSHLHSDVLS